MKALLPLLLLLAPALSQELRVPADRPFDLVHVDLRGKIDLKERTFEGRVRLDLVARRAVRTIRLDAVSLAVASVRVAGDAKLARHANDGRRLLLELETPVRPGAQLRVEVAYTATNPEKGLYFFQPTEAEPDTPFQAWTQGETLEARHWIPIFDQPNERHTFEIAVTHEAHLQVLSNGMLVGRAEHEDGSATTTWRQNQELVPYLITLVVGTFHVAREEWRGKPVEYWVPPDRKDDVPYSFGNTKRMLEFFTEKIGVDYPWDKYAQVVVEQFRWGGMENTSATTLTERTLHDRRAHLDFSSDGLVAHELAHQWFGDLLTCRDWAHTWLNEGFATYCEALWGEYDEGRDAFLYNMLGKARGAIRGGRKLPIVHRHYTSPWQQFDARAYPKGAWVLHMIRRRVGDDRWWKAVRHYVTKHANQCVETVDLRKAVEEATAENFERFFLDWTARAAHPQVRVDHRWDAEARLMEVRVRQTQKEAAWAFPLAIEYRFAQDTEPVRLARDIDAKDMRFYVPLRERPFLVRVDPSFAVLMELTEHKPRDLWVHQLLDDPDPIQRIRAAEHFGASKRPPDRAVLAQALGRDPFWGAQVEIAKALGTSGGDASRDVLLQALSLPHPKARRAVVEALGKFREDETVASALGGVVRNGDESYYVEAAAITAWANLQPEGALAALEPLLDRDSHNDVIRHAALEGIGAQRDPAATDLLVKWTMRGKPRGSRQAALRGLARLAKAGQWDDDTAGRVVRAVTRCLHPIENTRVKSQAAQTLRDLGVTSAAALPALEALVEHDPSENVRKDAKAAIDKIRAGAPAPLELTRLRDELRKLREAERKLEERLEKLEAK